MDSSIATREDVVKFEQKIDRDISAMRTDVAVLKWMVGLVIAGVAAQILKSFFG